MVPPQGFVNCSCVFEFGSTTSQASSIRCVIMVLASGQQVANRSQFFQLLVRYLNHDLFRGELRCVRTPLNGSNCIECR